MPIAFSIKSLLVFVAAIAVTIVGSQKFHSLYCLQELKHRARVGDTCSVSETLRYARDRKFSEDWADEFWVAAAKGSELRMLSCFVLENDINRSIDGRRTALMVAATNGNFNATKFLLAQRADATITDSSNRTAFDLAVTGGHKGVAELLMAYQQTSWDAIS